MPYHPNKKYDFRAQLHCIMKGKQTLHANLYLKFTIIAKDNGQTIIYLIYKEIYDRQKEDAHKQQYISKSNVINNNES